MDDPEKRKFLGDLKIAIAKAEHWADEKISTGTPASPVESEAIESLLATLSRIKDTLAAWKAN